MNWVEDYFWATDVCFVASQKDESNDIKYIFYCVKNRQGDLESRIYGGNLPKLNKAYLWDLQIPLPPLPVQHEIVRILDTFDSLCASLSFGLPAEIKTRQEQYEYYRDKLLTFKELKS